MQCCKIVFTLVIVLCSFACVAMAENGVEQDVRQSCSGCHGLKKVCMKLGSANAEEWESIVRRMVANGAYLADEKVVPVSAYLATVKASNTAFCP